MFFKRFFLPLLLFEIGSLLLIGAIYALIIYNWNANWPTWFTWLFPLIISLLLLFIFKNSLFKISSAEVNPFNGLISNLLLFIGIPVLTVIFFIPLSQSLRYNFGQVKRLQSINELKAHERPAFLDVEDWYVDRMRVIPLKTVSKPGLFSSKRLEVNVLFIVPVFSREDAYQTFAKAWLAFDYHQTFTKAELQEGRDDEFVNSSLTHFRRMNIREFRYLEAYPRGNQYDAFVKMAQVHNYFKTGFGTVYKGQEVDRDYLSAYFLKYFLFLFSIIGIPVILVLSLLFRVLQKNGLSRNNGS